MSSFNFKRLNHTLTIYRVVQFILLALLAFMAFIFQNRYGLLGKPDHFFKSLIFSIIIQIFLVYPLYRLAWRDAGIELDSSVLGISVDVQKALRKKRLLSDLWKMSVILFFLVFVVRAPGAEKMGTPFFQSTALFSFLLIFLTYFQCFNFSAKKRMKQVS